MVIGDLIILALTRHAAKENKQHKNKSLSLIMCDGKVSFLTRMLHDIDSANTHKTPR